MAAIPTLEEEDAKRPTREREQLVGKRTGIVNRMKAALVRLGIRGYRMSIVSREYSSMIRRTIQNAATPWFRDQTSPYSRMARSQNFWMRSTGTYGNRIAARHPQPIGHLRAEQKHWPAPVDRPLSHIGDKRVTQPQSLTSLAG
jgi:hypothetical protein